MDQLLSTGLVTRVAEAWPPDVWADVTVLVAVSGGADSVALLRALARLKSGGSGRLIVAHFNHRLRGAESDEDATFVVALAQQLALPVEIGYPVHDLPRATEESARNERYRFLREASHKWGARYAATAHTADDQAETILHRILRGTSISGLAGIPRVRRLTSATTLVRPLLAVRRFEVVGYLAALGQQYRCDSTNADRCYTRNRLRQLLPQLQKDFNPRVTEALLRLGNQAGQAMSVVNGLVEGLWEQAVRPRTAGRVEVSLAPLAGQAPYLLKELAVQIWRSQGWPRRDLGNAHWEAIAGMMNRVGPAIVLPGAIEARRTEETLIFQPIGSSGNPGTESE